MSWLAFGWKGPAASASRHTSHPSPLPAGTGISDPALCSRGQRAAVPPDLAQFTTPQPAAGAVVMNCSSFMLNQRRFALRPSRKKMPSLHRARHHHKDPHKYRTLLFILSLVSKDLLAFSQYVHACSERKPAAQKCF